MSFCACFSTSRKTAGLATATRVQLRHFGWGTGEEWLATRDYFAGAWEVVLNRLEYRFARGPVDWDRIGEIDGLLYSGEGSGS